MLDIIRDNPYRILGVYSTSPQREIVANQGRMKAFLHVGKNVSFPLDLPNVLPAISRTEENVKEATAKLTLPADQLRFAQFWFAKVTRFDDIACAKLINEDIDGAISIWSKKDNASSLQNRIICALIRGQYGETINCAECLYSDYAADFVKMVLGDNAAMSSDNLANDFLNVLCESVGANAFLQYVTNPEWKQYVGSKSSQPLIDAISAAITQAKASRGKGSTARYNAGTKLKNDTKASLSQLKKFVAANDLQYQMIADKLGLEILQCGIDYYNDSEARDAAQKAMALQKYAQSIVVGKMAKDRCKENVDILNDIIAKLPPSEVFDEDRAIKEELRKYCQLPDKICHAITLLNNTKPHLQAIKQKLGGGNKYYLETSTLVVSNALHNIIEEVNAAQKDNDDDVLIFRTEHDKAISALLRLETVKEALTEAWKATLIMDTFDMETDFKVNRYNPNRSTLKDLCAQLGITTSIFTKPTTPRPTSATYQSNSSTYHPSPTSNSQNNSSDGAGCWGYLTLAAIGAVIGGIIGEVGGAIVGGIIGLSIYAKLADKKK